MAKIVFSHNDFIVAYKDHNMKTVPLKGQSLEGTLLGFVVNKYPEVNNVRGHNSWEGGTIHRLDTVTSGLVVFARNQKFYDWLFQNKDFEKIYVATLSESTNKEDRIVKTYFRAFGEGRKLVKPETDPKKADSQILYETKIKKLDSNTLECKIFRGFRHQIRSHLASYYSPILGDTLYGGKEDEYVHLECVHISFPLLNGEKFSC